MAPKKKSNGKEPMIEEGEEGEEEDAEETKKDAPLRKETGAQIVHNLLEAERISTPHPQRPFHKWDEWTCLHCDTTYYPGKNFETTVLRDSDVTAAITKHFAKKRKVQAERCHPLQPCGSRGTLGTPFLGQDF